MADKKRSTSYENKVSKVVKPIGRWLRDALKFFCNDIAQIVSEIYGVSRS